MRCGVALALFLVLASSVASGQAILRTIDLGDGMSVHAVSGAPGICVFTRGPCFSWQGVGIDIARRDALLLARTYVRVPGTSRVLASVPSGAGLYYRNAGVLYTDDRGVTWGAARWPSANVATAIAFDDTGALGVGVGPSRGIWITEDRGLSFVERASSAGLGYVDVAVVGTTIVIVDEGHEAWRSRDRGFSLTSVGAEVREPLRVVAGAIEVVTASRTYRVMSDGTVRR